MAWRDVSGSVSRPSFEHLEARVLLSGAQQVLELFSVSPALFVENQGQWADPSIRYVHSGSGANVAMTDDGVIFEVFRQEPRDGAGGEDLADAWDIPGDLLLEQQDYVTQSAQFSVRFDGANAVSPVGLDEAETVFNYFLADQSNWRSNVSAYEIVAYENLYEGIDLHTWGRRDSLKYEFRVAPGADYSQIEVSYEEIEGLWIDDKGSLHVQTGLGELIDDAPYIYQEIDGERVEIAGSFELIDIDTYSFNITGAYDPAEELIVDPSLAWSSYLGWSDWEEGLGIAVDSSGNALVTGLTTTNISGANNALKGPADAFVAKVSSGGSLLWATYLGGSGSDGGYGIAVDSSGNALVTGYTYSSDFPGANNAHKGNGDAFAAKVSSGGSLLWATHLGGSGFDGGYGIAVDSSGNALVTGPTRSTDFSGANNAYKGGLYDAFVAKVSSGGSLLWATYLGGSDDDYGRGIAVDSSGNALVTGNTHSSDFSGANNTHKGNIDAFVAKVSSGGSLLWATYLGGSDYDRGRGIAVDSSGNALVAGNTHSTDFFGANNAHKGGGNDAFVAKVSSGGSLLWATHLGGSGFDYGWGVAVDSSGNALVTGLTASTNFSGANNAHKGGTDAFVAKVSSGGSLLWATYLGGSDADYGRGIAVDSSGSALVTGDTMSSDFSGANNAHKGGYYDAFVAKIYDGFPITGHITYKDQAGNTRDATYVWVEVWENETAWPDYQITEGYTDATGHFAFSHDIDGEAIVNEDTGPFESGTRDIYFKIRAENEAAEVSTELLGGVLGVVYWYDSDTEYDISGPVYERNFHFVATGDTPDHAAGWGLPGEVKSHKDWLLGITNPYYARETLDVLFPDGDWPSLGWSFLWWEWDVMRIPETWSGQTWQTSPQTVAHEYGHAVHWSVRGEGFPDGDVPVGEEDPNDGTPDAGEGSHWIYSESSEEFAFTEGWAQFFACARYDDPALSGDMGIESNDYWMGADGNDFWGPNTDDNLGNIVEGATASILWDLWDSGQDDDDGVGDLWPNIWEVFREDVPDSIWNPAGSDDFYHYWTSRYGQTLAVDEVFIDHGIPVRDDTYEGNDTSGQAAVLSDTTATYSDLICTDEDWFRFSTYGTSSSSSNIEITFDHDRGRLELFVYDSALSLISSQIQGDWPWRDDDTLTVSFAGKPADTYYVKVAGFGNDSGSPGYEGDMSPNYSLVLDVNASPVAIDDNFQVQEDSGANALNVLANDSDPDPGDTLTVIAVGVASHGTASLAGGQVYYTPATDYYGPDSFDCTISDEIGATDTATSYMTVLNVNDNPDAQNDNFTVYEDSGANALSVLANDTYIPDPPETLTITAVTQGGHGQVVITGGGTGLTYRPDNNFYGQDSFSYTITDDGSLTDTASVSVTVQAVPGDLDGDGSINSDDINPFVLALADPDAYMAQYGLDPHVAGDCDGSGKLDSDDISPFVNLIAAGAEATSAPAGSASELEDTSPSQDAQPAATLTDFPAAGVVAAPRKVKTSGSESRTQAAKARPMARGRSPYYQDLVKITPAIRPQTESATPSATEPGSVVPLSLPSKSVSFLGELEDEHLGADSLDLFTIASNQAGAGIARGPRLAVLEDDLWDVLCEPQSTIVLGM